MEMMKGAIDVIPSRRSSKKFLNSLCRMNSARSRICYQRPPRAPLPFLLEPLPAEDFPLFPLFPVFPLFSDCCCVPEDAAASA